jgi:hypothetical protein
LPHASRPYSSTALFVVNRSVADTFIVAPPRANDRAL